MPKYNVLITINQYVEMEGDTPVDAEMAAYQAYRKGDIQIDEYPIFICEEEDLIEEDENA